MTLIDCVINENSMLIARMSFIYQKMRGVRLQLSSERDIIELLNSDLKDEDTEFANKRLRLLESLTDECKQKLTYRGVAFIKVPEAKRTGKSEVTYRGRKIIIDNESGNAEEVEPEEVIELGEATPKKKIKGYYRGQPVYED